MYIPPQYQNNDPEKIREFIRDNSFGILVCNSQNVPMATHLPLELESDNSGKDLIRGHFARANPQWKEIQEGDEVLCIFNGPHAYVSSSWYREEEVPTWNYIAVHLRGIYRTQSDQELWNSLHRLVDKYEKHSKHPLNLDDLSEETLRQVQGIVGFEIAVTDIQAAYE